MKNYLPRFILTLLITTFLLSSCKKSDESVAGFTWSYRGTNYNASYIRASSVEDLGPNIMGTMGSGSSGGTGVRFRIYPLVAGVYAIGPGQSSGGFVDPEGYDLPTVGVLNITSVSGNKLSGNFMLTVGPAGSQYDVMGTISNIQITQ